MLAACAHKDTVDNIGECYVVEVSKTDNTAEEVVISLIKQGELNAYALEEKDGKLRICTAGQDEEIPAGLSRVLAERGVEGVKREKQSSVKSEDQPSDRESEKSIFRRLLERNLFPDDFKFPNIFDFLFNR